MVRQRSRPGQGPGKAKRSLCRKDSSGSMSENPLGKEDGLSCIILHYKSILKNLVKKSLIQSSHFFESSFVAGWAEALPDTPVDEMPPGPEVPEKIKKRYRKKKTKLEEAFPTYLQV